MTFESHSRAALSRVTVFRISVPLFSIKTGSDSSPLVFCAHCQCTVTSPRLVAQPESPRRIRACRRGRAAAVTGRMRSRAPRYHDHGVAAAGRTPSGFAAGASRHPHRRFGLRATHTVDSGAAGSLAVTYCQAESRVTSHRLTVTVTPVVVLRLS